MKKTKTTRILSGLLIFMLMFGIFAQGPLNVFAGNDRCTERYVALKISFNGVTTGKNIQIAKDFIVKFTEKDFKEGKLKVNTYDYSPKTIVYNGITWERLSQNSVITFNLNDLNRCKMKSESINYKEKEIVKPIEKYTVTFDSMGGSKVNPITNVEKGSTVTLPAPPTKDGFVFKGWFTELNHEFTSATPVNGDITVYAKWEKIKPVEKYTVTFDSMGGSKVNPITNVEKGSTVTLPTPPTKDGFVFKGWFTKEDGKGSEFASETPVNGNITVYAYWEKEKECCKAIRVKLLFKDINDETVKAPTNLTYPKEDFTDGKLDVSFNEYVPAEIQINGKTLLLTNPEDINQVLSLSDCDPNASEDYIFTFVYGVCEDEEYTITSSAGGGGKISPLGEATVLAGKDQKYIITPDSGYKVSKILIDGVALTTLPSDGTYTFIEVCANHTIHVEFEKTSSTTTPKTGDTNNFFFLGLLVFISSVGFVVFCKKRSAL